MNIKQEKFVECYIASGGNAKQAAIDAGYAVSSADVQACRLLKNANVYALIEQRKDEILGRLKLDAFNRIAMLKDMAFAHKTQAKYDNKRGEWVYSQPMADNTARLKARELICRLAGDFSEDESINVKMDGVIFEDAKTPDSDNSTS